MRTAGAARGGVPGFAEKEDSQTCAQCRDDSTVISNLQAENSALIDSNNRYREANGELNATANRIKTGGLKSVPAADPQESKHRGKSRCGGQVMAASGSRCDMARGAMSDTVQTMSPDGQTRCGGQVAATSKATDAIMGKHPAEISAG